ncbi:MAG: 4Fe-4S dicluster domain-containing protein [Desulfobacterales bacterium]|nr:4Fe-4S dicluster domain-containing protein [Desulfobacterales bacterium]
MPKGLVIDIGRCTGCGYCELVCSFTHHGEFNPLKSRISVNMFISRSMAVPVVCSQCDEPLCAKACPSGALQIKISAKDGSKVIEVDTDQCVGCKMCTLACPFGCVVVSEGKAEKCDLCGGDPQCVRFCRTKAIRFGEENTSISEKKKNMAERLLGSFQEE